MTKKTFYIEKDTAPSTSTLTGAGGHIINGNTPVEVKPEVYSITFSIDKTDLYTLAIDGTTIFEDEKIDAMNNTPTADTIMTYNTDSKIYCVQKKGMFNKDLATETEVRQMTSEEKALAPKSLSQFIDYIENVRGIEFASGVELVHNDIKNKIVTTDNNGKFQGETKGTAFNKNFGTGSTNVATGNHSHIINKVAGNENGFFGIKSITDTQAVTTSKTEVVFTGITLLQYSILIGINIRIDSDLTVTSGATYSYKTKPTGVGSAKDIVTNLSDTAQNTHIDRIHDPNGNNIVVASESNIALEMDSGYNISGGSITVTAYYMYISPMDNIGT